jgi:4-hydroxybenzoate polyprenyltransferase
MLRLILASMRPSQWVKNTVVFAAVVFAGRLFVPADLLRSVGAFVIFCMVSGAAYLFNDVRDARTDRHHETKRLRPVASGRLSAQAAAGSSGVLVVVALAASALLGRDFVVVILAYVALSTAYSLYLKHVVILDVMAVAAGFMLRAIAGAAAVNVEISAWLVICTIFLSLFIAVGKRRHELVFMTDSAAPHRSVLAEYSPQLLDQMIAVVATSTVIVYTLYTTSPDVQLERGTTKLYITIPFVVYGIFRYLYLVHNRQEGGKPEQVLFSDIPLLVSVLLWAGAACVALYVWH